MELDIGNKVRVTNIDSLNAVEDTVGQVGTIVDINTQYDWFHVQFEDEFEGSSIWTYDRGELEPLPSDPQQIFQQLLEFRKDNQVSIYSTIHGVIKLKIGESFVRVLDEIGGDTE